MKSVFNKNLFLIQFISLTSIRHLITFTVKICTFCVSAFNLVPLIVNSFHSYNQTQIQKTDFLLTFQGPPGSRGAIGIRGPKGRMVSSLTEICVIRYHHQVRWYATNVGYRKRWGRSMRWLVHHSHSLTLMDPITFYVDKWSQNVLFVQMAARLITFSSATDLIGVQR